MGLTKKLQEKFGSKDTPSEDYQKRRQAAEKLKERQEEWEAEQKGMRKEKLRQAERRGVQKARGGSGVGSAIEAIGSFGVGMARVGSKGMPGFFAPPPKPKPKPRKQVVVVKVVGASGSTRRTTRRSTPKKKKHPYDLDLF